MTQSLNYCFQALLTIQRDVSSLQAASAAAAAQNKPPSQQQQPLDDNMDSVSQQRDFESHEGSSSWEFDFHGHPQEVVSTPRGPAAASDPWNNFFSAAAADRITAGGSETSGTSGALNNTVPPGIRANNYWDNFRSFSRQNRLSASVAAANLAPATGLSPMVAQVTPRQAPHMLPWRCG